MRRVLAALALGVLLVSPLVEAHLARDRPHIQRAEENRRVAASVVGTAATYELSRTIDPFEDSLVHLVDPAGWTIRIEYRTQPSDARTAFVARWDLVRLVEYRDLNTNARFEPKGDTVVRSWKFAQLPWNVTGPREVAIGDASAQDVTYVANVSGGPHFKLEVDAAGTVFTDEGATVHSQDLILYLDITELPPRGLGDLYAFEGLVTSSAGDVAPDIVDPAVLENGTAGILVRAPHALAELDWGAQATLDRAERDLNLTLDARDANGATPFRIDLPIFDKTLHMVMVSSMEYTAPPAKLPAPALALVLGALAALAVARPRRGR